jgi:hypothetical protein
MYIDDNFIPLSYSPSNHSPQPVFYLSWNVKMMGTLMHSKEHSGTAEFALHEYISCPCYHLPPEYEHTGVVIPI